MTVIFLIRNGETEREERKWKKLNRKMTTKIVDRPSKMSGRIVTLLLPVRSHPCNLEMV